MDRSISLINRLDVNKFGKLLERVILKLPLSADQRPMDVFSMDEREKLIQVFELQSQSELSSVLEWIVKSIQDAGFDQSKSEELQEKLLKSHLNRDHADALIRVWSTYGHPFIDRLKSKSISAHQLIDVGFVLNVDVASDSKSQINQSTACLQFSVENMGKTADKLTLELDHGQLLNLYDKLEDIQKQLDALTG